MALGEGLGPRCPADANRTDPSFPMFEGNLGDDASSGPLGLKSMVTAESAIVRAGNDGRQDHGPCHGVARCEAAWPPGKPAAPTSERSTATARNMLIGTYNGGRAPRPRSGVPLPPMVR
jgi:hypothetical protein